MGVADALIQLQMFDVCKVDKELTSEVKPYGKETGYLFGP